MLKKNNFVKFIFSLLLLLSIFAFSFNVSNNVVEASTLSIYEMDPNYETIVFKPTADISVREIGITFVVDDPDISIAAIFDYTNNPDDIDYLIEPDGDKTSFDCMFPFITSNIVYEAGKEYCIKFGNAENWYISNVINWDKLGITHINFNYFRFTNDFEVPFLYSSCVKADFRTCLNTPYYSCTTIFNEFFSGCSFEEIYLPLGLEDIYAPFFLCENLNDIYFRTFPSFIRGVALGCYNLKRYWFKDSNEEFYSTQFISNGNTLYSMVGGSIPSDVLYINSWCFSSFENDTLIIPSTVSRINDKAFESAIIGDLIFTSQIPTNVDSSQGFYTLERIIVPYGSYDTYMTHQFFIDYSDIVVKSEKPLWSISLITSIISILMGGISSLSYGIGNGLTDLVSSIFVSSNGGLSLFGGVIIVFAGISLAIGLCRLIISFITSLGGDD